MSAELINLLITIFAPIVSSVLAVLVSLFLAKLIKKGKEGNKLDAETANDVLKVSHKVLKNSPVTLNTDKIIELIEVAEAHPNFTSEEKLDYVLTSYQQYCIDNNFKFVKDVITEAINKLINLTKKVNRRPKDCLVEDEPSVNLNIPNSNENTKGIYS